MVVATTLSVVLIVCIMCIVFIICIMWKSHEMDSVLKLIFSNTNGLLTCYSMYPQK